MILDASVAVKLVVAEPGTIEAREVCFRQPSLSAPDWVLIEGDATTPVQVDGDVSGPLPLSIKTHREQLRIILA